MAKWNQFGIGRKSQAAAREQSVASGRGRIIKSMESFDTVLIGGGIIGCSLARKLAKGGQRVAVIDRSAPGQEASWAAAGMLSASAEAETDSPLFTLCRASLAAYKHFAEELFAETGVDPQYRSDGTVVVFSDTKEREETLASIEWQRAQGISIEELSSKELHHLEPALSAFPGAFSIPQDHQIDNRLLMHALIQSCRQEGVEFLLGNPVRRVVRNGNRVGGVALAANGGGERQIAARCVVNTAGAWASEIEIPGVAPVPIRPVKGHMLALAAPAILRHVIRSHKAYLVPRKDGRILVGSTMEEAGFDKTPRAGEIAALLSAAQVLCPSLGESAVSEVWAGLRPAASDGLPVLGPTELEGYWLALGHFRNGILLAPITAEILSSWLLTGNPSLNVDAFSPERFTREAPARR